MARLTPFDVGQVKAHAFHGLGPASIARIVEKTDGASPSEQSIGDVLRKLTQDPEWRGERQARSGRRKKKTLVPTLYTEGRMAFAQPVMRMHTSSLGRWAYTDGTVFYLYKSGINLESTHRAALGAFVWRRADRIDALYADCVGPSVYSKSQGVPVRCDRECMGHASRPSLRDYANTP